MRRPLVLIVLAVALVSLNLRAAIAAVPPILDELTRALGMTTAGASLLTTLPVLCFALAAPFAAYLGRRAGPGHAILFGLTLIIVGTVGRVLGGSVVLLTGTLVLGIGMTIGNVLVPVVAKRDLGDRAPWLIGVYTASLSVGATLTAALTVPATGVLGWRGGLSLWVVLALVAVPVWVWVVVRPERVPGPVATSASQRAAQRRAADQHAARTGRVVWRHPLAWVLAIALGSQSALYYSLTTWMPAFLIEESGMSTTTAGLALSVFQLTAIPATLATPWAARLRPSQGWIAGLTVSAWILMLFGLHLAPELWLLWTAIGGAGQGAGFALALTMIVLRSADEHVARPLSGMGQLVGYLIGASGPLAVGLLRESTGSWTVPGVLLLAVAITQLITMAIGGRDRQIHAPA